MKAVWFAVFAGICWGVGEVFTKSVLHTEKIGPLTAIAVRSTIALPFLWLACWWAISKTAAEPQDWFRAEGATLLKLALGSGLIAGAGGMIFFYAALNLGEVSRIKPIAFTLAPAIGILLGWTILGETMTVQKGAGIFLVLGGLILLASGSS